MPDPLKMKKKSPQLEHEVPCKLCPPELDRWQHLAFSELSRHLWQQGSLECWSVFWRQIITSLWHRVMPDVEVHIGVHKMIIVIGCQKVQPCRVQELLVHAVIGARPGNMGHFHGAHGGNTLHNGYPKMASII